MTHVTATGGPLDLKHLGKQTAVGLIVGAAAGYAENQGYHNVTIALFAILVAAMVLDHLGYVQTPWGYKGPGFNEGHNLRGLSAERGAYIIVNFPIRNAALFTGTVLAYYLITGRPAPWK